MGNKTKLITLYKYLSFERNNGVNHSLDVILNNALFFASQNLLNDPFEMLDSNGNPLNLKIVSLTNSNAMKLMWSHYANGHKGICITIRVPEEDVYPVIYSKRVYKITNISSLTKGNTKKANVDYKFFNNDNDFAIIKDRKWKYEKEYRLVYKDGIHDSSRIVGDSENHFYRKFKIDAVYLGVNFFKNKNKDDIDKLLVYLRTNNIKIKQMVLSKTDYSIKATNYKENNI